MVTILRNCDPMADCKPVVLMSCFLLIFWLLLSYVTNSYFAIFLMVSNFILIFGCCVSLSGYVVGQFIDTRTETGQVIEVTTISGSQPFVRPPEYPPTYEEATRVCWQHCCAQTGGDGVVLCIPLETEHRPIYMNALNNTTAENTFLPLNFNGSSNFSSTELTPGPANVRAPLPLMATSSAISDMNSYPNNSITSSTPSESSSVSQVQSASEAGNTQSVSGAQETVLSVTKISESEHQIENSRSWRTSDDLSISFQYLEESQSPPLPSSRHLTSVHRSQSFPG